MEDEKFLEKLLLDLEHRYTDNDEDYRTTCAKEPPKPPILKIVVERRPSYYEDNFRRNYRKNRPDNYRKQSSFHPYRRDNNSYSRNDGYHGDNRKFKQNYDKHNGNHQKEESKSFLDKRK